MVWELGSNCIVMLTKVFDFMRVGAPCLDTLDSSGFQLMRVFPGNVSPVLATDAVHVRGHRGRDDRHAHLRTFREFSLLLLQLSQNPQVLRDRHFLNS